MSKTAPLNNGTASLKALPGEDDDICPVCKSSRYLNPNMRFLLNPECYHKMCESCVDRIFSHGPAPCPVAGCHRTLRKQRFRRQTFEDVHVEREVDVRKRVAQVFNRRQEEFTSLKAFNDYLEEVESITFNLLNGIDVAQTEAKLASYARANAASISRNVSLQQQESADLAAHRLAEREHARLRREAARREDEAERLLREEDRREVLHLLAAAPPALDDPAGATAVAAQKIVHLKRSSARRSAAATSSNNNKPDDPQSQPAPAPTFLIKGLKPAPSPPTDRHDPHLLHQPYDPFHAPPRPLTPRYFTLRDHYDHPWLDDARADPRILAAGYDLRDYYARSLVDAFAGLGVFVAEERAARGQPPDGEGRKEKEGGGGGGDGG